MAGQLTQTANFGQLIGDVSANAALSFSGVRAIGNLYPHVVVKEAHTDTLEITTHPIETGTPVTDHAFPMPYTVEIMCGWSNSKARSEGFSQAVYKQLQALQQSRKPFSIRTGKRNYTSMLLASININTDSESEYSLIATLLAQQIVITSTQTTGASGATNSDGNHSIVGAGGPGKPGELGTPVAGGADPAPPGAVTPDANGAVTWPNDPASTGTLSLPGAPSNMDWQQLQGKILP